MEKNDEMNAGQWVDDRLARLAPDSEWHPDAIRGLARFRELRSGRRERWRRLTWALAAATAASLCLMALPAPRALAQRCLNCSVALWQNLSTSGVRADVKPAKDRKMAPDFTLNDASGKPVRLSAFKGKVVLLNFWATWCGGCKVEIPWLIEFQQTYGSRDFVVLGVSFDEDGWKLVTPFMNDKKMNYPVVIGNPQIAALYGGVESLPTTVVIDKLGRIAATHVGLPRKNDYKAEIEALLAAR